MNKSILKILTRGGILTAVALLPFIDLSAREGGGGVHVGGGSGYHANYNHNYHPNYGNYDHRADQNYNYGGGGYYGGTGGYGGVVYPYPDPESQPGMSDDSNALYQSYLRHNGQGY